MNSPAGFTLADGRPVDVSPLAAMLNPASLTETIHMTLAAFAASGFAVAGIHAFLLLRNRENAFHRKALEIALVVGGIAAVLQPLSGDMNARFVARNQPVKLAALEGQFETERGAPLRIGGIPDVASRTTRYAIEIPKGLSLLAYHDPDARVQGLAAFPRDEWPDPVPVHLAFQAMVAGGTALALLSVAAAWLFRKKREGIFGRRFLIAVALCGPVGLLCVEAGWGVTEMGRQPWAIRGVMRTAEAVTPVGGLLLPFAFFSLLYLGLGAASVWLLGREVAASPFFPADGGWILRAGGRSRACRIPQRWRPDASWHPSFCTHSSAGPISGEASGICWRGVHARPIGDASSPRPSAPCGRRTTYGSSWPSWSSSRRFPGRSPSSARPFSSR